MVGKRLDSLDRPKYARNRSGTLSDSRLKENGTDL